MAVLPMEKMRVTALKRDRKKLLNILQRRGMVEVTDAGAADEIFYKKNTSTSRATYEKAKQSAEDAVAILDKYVPYKAPSFAFLRGRKAVSPQFNEDFYAKDDILVRRAQQVVEWQRELVEAQADLVRAKARERAIEPWMNLPVPQTFAGTKKTAVLIGQIEGAYTLACIAEKLGKAAPTVEALHLEIVYSSKELTCLYALVLKKDAAQTEAALRLMGFVRPPSPTHLLPAEKRVQLQERKEKAYVAIAKAEEKIKDSSVHREDFIYLADHMAIRQEKHVMMERLLQTRHTFVLEGYVLQKDAEPLMAELTQSFTCMAEGVPLAEGEEAPVQLKNNWFAEPTESVVESYSLPGKNDIDPTSVMSVFYYIMFGLMFSDAGYGFIMAAACLVLLVRFKNMEEGWNRYLRMFFWCGISTVFWGIIFSSYFGDVVTVVSTLFFGTAKSIPPVWFLPLDNPMKLLIFCLAVGIVHLTAAYVMKALTCIKNKAYIDILYDVVFPVVTFYALLVVVVSSEMFASIGGFSVPVPPWGITASLAVAGVCMVGVVFTAGRESKNWGKRLLKGAYGLYNVLAGWLGDVLSYARLLALGLATGVIATVVNSLAAMLGGGIVGAIGFMLIFLLGQGMNFGINILGAYVHSNRLEYVEFFGKFYEGGGRKFQPFGIHTKHYKFEEEHTDG